MSMNLKKSKLPPVYKRNGKKCYLDPIRKRLIYITPEETIRQKVISYLLKELDVPEDMIKVEEPLSHYGLKSKERADIVNKIYGNTLDVIVNCPPHEARKE